MTHDEEIEIEIPEESDGFNLRRFMVADGSSEGGLSNIVVSRTGSGKTEWLRRMVHDSRYLDSDEFENKIVFVSPKEEDILGAEVVTEPEEIVKVLEKEDLVVYVPSPESYSEDVDSVLDKVFEMQNEIPMAGDKTLSYHIVLDDSSIFLSANKPPSPAFKRLVIAGRGKHIKGTFVVHRFGQLNRLLSGNIGDLIVMSVANTDRDIVPRLFAFDIGDLGDSLSDYRWAWVNLLSNNPKPIRYEGILPVEE